MTKRWSSTRSADGNTKQSASKSSRRKADLDLVKRMFDECGADVEFVDVTEDVSDDE